MGLVLLAAGCGGSSGKGMAKVGTATPTTPSSQTGSGSRGAVAYAACLRRNGVPSFPDPASQADI
jgi:hypothetical protein